MICYDLPTISTFNLLINSWYGKLCTLKWVAHFRGSDVKLLFDFFS